MWSPLELSDALPSRGESGGAGIIDCARNELACALMPLACALIERSGMGLDCNGGPINLPSQELAPVAFTLVLGLAWNPTWNEFALGPFPFPFPLFTKLVSGLNE
jgi:hypothetical protein